MMSTLRSAANNDLRTWGNLSDIEFNPNKWVQHISRFEALARGDDVFPVTVELDPVDYCNHSCGWCVDPRHGNNTLDESLALRLLDELRELQVHGIVYKGGGEPTLHPQFGNLLETASRQYGFEVGVVTNGSRLHAWSTELLDVSYLRISIDGPTPEFHQQIHGSGDFETIVEGTKNLIKERGMNRHPVIGLSFAMDTSTMHCINDAVNLGDSLGVDYSLFRTPFFEEVGRDPTMTLEETEVIRTAFKSAKQAYNGKMEVFIDHWISDKEAAIGHNTKDISPRRGSYLGNKFNGIEHAIGSCRAAPLLAVVTADGTVYPCCNLRGLRQWAMGQLDYKKGITFESIWKGSQRQHVMNNIHQIRCINHCTHPLSKYNEAINYLQGPRYHGSFI